jgi:hypothetical protein
MRLHEIKGVSSIRVKRSKFSPDEDDWILRRVSQHGAGDWAFIEKGLPGGTKRQVRERLLGYLNPELASKYTTEEDQLLQSLFCQIGPKWATIAIALRHKSGISVRNRFRILTYKKRKEAKRQLAAQQLTPSPVIIDWSAEWQSGGCECLDWDLSEEFNLIANILGHFLERKGYHFSRPHVSLAGRSESGT